MCQSPLLLTRVPAVCLASLSCCPARHRQLPPLPPPSAPGGSLELRSTKSGKLHGALHVRSFTVTQAPTFLDYISAGQ